MTGSATSGVSLSAVVPHIAVLMQATCRSDERRFPPSFHCNCVTDISHVRIVGVAETGAPVLETILSDIAGFRMIENCDSPRRLADTLRGLLPAPRSYRPNNEGLAFGSQRAVRRRGENFDDGEI